ncbi:docking protein 2-like [Haliotis rubra]|uniref:docking protein 2-like n=1 Tax=Haliotis rubra TaxID=36100 RepID=UPI001EE5802D|nr:docking protein 2-like [Haliotis rubra]
MDDHSTFFRVNISGDEKTSKRCHLKGMYDVAVKDTGLCLCDVRSNRVMYEWPYTRIRNYGKTRTQFHFEAGRNTLSGEGVFTMETGDGAAIMNSIIEKIEKVKAVEAHVQRPADGRRKESREEKGFGNEDADHLYENTANISYVNIGLYNKMA